MMPENTKVKGLSLQDSGNRWGISSVIVVKLPPSLSNCPGVFPCGRSLGSGQKHCRSHFQSLLYL